MRASQFLFEGYSGYLVKNAGELLEKIPPRFPKIIAHHVTHQFPAKAGQLPPDIVQALITHDYWDEDLGIQALAVEIDGNSTRPDGKKYHITWSLDPAKGAKPVTSNRILNDTPITTQIAPIIPAIPVKLETKFFEK